MRAEVYTRTLSLTSDFLPSALMGHGSYVSILYDEIAEILELDEEGTEDEQECVEAARQRS